MKAVTLRERALIAERATRTSPVGAVRGVLVRRWATRVAGGAWALAVFLLWMPFAIQFPGSGLDASWVFGLVMAFNRRMQWGHDIVFTYGPLAAIEHNSGYMVDPGLWPVSLGFAVAVNLAFAITFAFFLRAFDAHPLTWGLALLVVLLPVPVWALPEIELLLLTIMVFTLAVRLDHGGALLAGAGGALIAIQVLNKGTLLISGASILAGFATAAWITRRRRFIPVALASAVVLFLILYVAVGQSFGSLAAYLRTTYELVAGYSPAMSTFADQPPEINPGLVRLCALALVPVTAAEVVIAFRRRNRGLLAVTLICVPMMFLSFKEGFVRWHIDYFVTIAALLQLLILIAGLTPRRRSGRKTGPARLDLDAVMTAVFWRRHLPPLSAPALAAILLVPVVMALVALPNLNQSLWPTDTLGHRIATYQRAAALLQGTVALDRTAAAEQANVLATDPLPDAFLARIGHASVDVMPWDVDVIAANHLNWTPRPVLGSYTSYTAYLDDIDAAFFRSAAAPEYVITTYRTIDNRYALFEEPAMQRALFEGYRVDAIDANWVLLRRTSNLCPCAMRELGTVTAGVGQAVKTPAVAPGERLFVRVRLDYSLGGRAAELLLDPGAIRVKLTTGGSESSFRLVPGTAADGLLLSDVAHTPADLATVYSGCNTTGAVESIRIEPDNPAMYASTVSYDFFAEQTGPCLRVGGSPGP